MGAPNRQTPRLRVRANIPAMTNEIQTRALSAVNPTAWLIQVLTEAIIKSRPWRQRARWQRELQQLDIRQLSDAGIDPILARGGRASMDNTVRLTNLASMR